jgi:hypothetical protein
VHRPRARPNSGRARRSEALAQTIEQHGGRVLTARADVVGLLQPTYGVYAATKVYSPGVLATENGPASACPATAAWRRRGGCR